MSKLQQQIHKHVFQYICIVSVCFVSRTKTRARIKKPFTSPFYQKPKVSQNPPAMSSDSDSDSDRYSSIKQEKRSPSPIPRRSLKGKTSQNNTINISRNEKDDPNASLIREGGFQNRPSIEDYLAKRTALIIDDTSRKESPLYAEDLLDDCDEEEVWMIQCPRDINIEKLVGTKLNLNGARHKAKKEKVPLEYESEIINNERFVTVMCKSRERRPSHRLVSLKPTGLIRVQAKLEVRQYCLYIF